MGSVSKAYQSKPFAAQQRARRKLAFGLAAQKRMLARYQVKVQPSPEIVELQERIAAYNAANAHQIYL